MISRALLFSLLLAVAATPAWARKSDTPQAATPNLGIAAQVGDEAISSLDVANRVKFIIATAHFSDTPDVVERIRSQVIRSLVDEKLQLQEAKKNDITVTEQDINDAIASIEKQRGMPAGAINKMLEDGHVPKETFLQQIRAQLSWSKLLSKKVRPRIKVTDSDIAMAGTKYITPPQAKKSNVPQEYRIGVIVLPVDKPSREKEIDLLGAKLVKEVRGGASFEETYRQFSSAAAGAGGKFEPFWIRPEQLDPSVAKALEATNSGAITDPVRTHDGLTIIKVYETRNIDGSKPAPGEAPQENAPKPADHDQVYSLLFQQKMELEAQKYMRNLRRETYIDIR